MPKHIPSSRFFPGMPTRCHSNNNPQSRPGVCVYTDIFASVCACLHQSVLMSLCERTCVQSRTVLSETVPCHKTENINMLSLQQGASHQENNSARHTLCQPKHIVRNTPAKQNIKLTGKFTLIVLGVVWSKSAAFTHFIPLCLMRPFELNSHGT